ncbi:MAG TPA: hypothetical protein VGZ29_10240 [Terriglobia bacterium]|nr:hypothetical protein [Terriglobia bacterium]
MADRWKEQNLRETTLDSSLEKRLAIYAATAGAAGVGMLALAPPARAQIVYTPAHIPVPHNGYFVPIDLNHDGVSDFSFWIRTYADFGPYYVDLFLYARKAANAAERMGAVPAARLASGAVIGSAQEFTPAHLLFGLTLEKLQKNYSQRGTFSFCEGDWKQPQKDAYLGVRFAISGQLHYGWIRLSAGCQTGQGSGGVKGFITGYAFNSEPGQPILAGQESAVSADSGTSRDPGSLGLLALGSIGLDLWRRRE